MNDYEKQTGEHVLKRLGIMNKAFDTVKTIFDGDYAHYHSVPEANRNPNESNLFIPETRMAIEALFARLISPFLNSDKRPVDVVGRGPGDQERGDAQADWLHFRSQEMDLPLRLIPTIKQALILGNTAGMVVPNQDYRIVKRRLSMGERLLKRMGFKLTLYDRIPRYTGSVFIPLDIYDLRLDPEAINPDEGDKAFKMPVNLETLKRDLAEGIPYRNLAALEDGRKGSAEGGGDTDKKERKDGRPEGDTRPDERKQNLIRWEWWGTWEVKGGLYAPYKAMICRVVMVNEVVILIEPNPLGTGEDPFVYGRLEPDPFEVYSTGLSRALRSLQKEINALRNMRINVLNRLIGPMMLVREGALVDPESLRRFVPGKIIAVRGGERVSDVAMPLIPTAAASLMAAMSEETRTALDIQKRSSITDETRGLSKAFGGADQTATEFRGKMMSTLSEFETKANLFNQELIRRIYKKILATDQQLLDEPAVARIIEDGAARFFPVSPEEISGDADVILRIDASQGRELQQAAMLTQIIPALIQLDLPVKMAGKKIDWGELADQWLRRVQLPGEAPLIVDLTLEDQSRELALAQMGASSGGQGMSPAPKAAGQVPDTAGINQDINQTKGDANSAAMIEGVV